MNGVNEVLQQALQHHQAGKFQEAETLYRQVLEHTPDHPDALNLLATLIFQVGDKAQAETMIRKAIGLRPDAAHYHLNLAGMLIASGQRDLAVKSLRQALRLKPVDNQTWLNLGMQFAQLGVYDDARSCFKTVLKKMPDNAGITFNLARACELQGDDESAVRYYNKAIKLQPDLAEAYNNLGNVLCKQGKFELAIKNHQQSLTLKPDSLQACISMGNTLGRAGQDEAAVKHYQHSLEILPEAPELHNNLGDLLRQMGQYDAAKHHLEKALRLRPEFAQAHGNLGNLLQDQGQYEGAIEQYYRTLQLMPDSPEAYINLGNIYSKQNKYDPALDNYNKALRYRPESADFYFDMACVLSKQEKHASAVKYFLRALELRPDFVDAHNNLANALASSYQFRKAIDHYSAALAINPAAPELYNNLGDVLGQMGRTEEAVINYQEALRLQPDFMQARSNLLYLISYHVLRSPQEMLEAHQAWDRYHAVPASERYVHNHQGDTDKRLRIAYVSPDLRAHPVSSFFSGLLAGHDRSQVEVYCYAEIGQADHVTVTLKAHADGWCSTIAMSDAELAEQIHNDRIDILIDLAGHTAGNRLKAFSYKPAPVQASYLGYFTTTGLATMDYWITDHVLTPEDTIELATESIYRLPRCCLSYTPPDDAPDVVSRGQQDSITFGSFNDLSKVSPEAITLWSEVLKAVPASRLFIKARQLADQDMKVEILARFASHGIDADRLALYSRTAGLREHLDVYGEIDIALDTVPRTGGATTMEALWMGVPVITLEGGRFIERLSASMLTAAGLKDCIATSDADYISKAVALASDHEQRAQLRHGLRDRLMASPMCDGKALAQAMEAAYRDMWQRYLADKSA